MSDIGNEGVAIKVEVEGASDALAQLAQIKAALAGLNTDAVGDSSSVSGLSAPYDPYSSPRYSADPLQSDPFTQRTGSIVLNASVVNISATAVYVNNMPVPGMGSGATGWGGWGMGSSGGSIGYQGGGVWGPSGGSGAVGAWTGSGSGAGGGGGMPPSGASPGAGFPSLPSPGPGGGIGGSPWQNFLASPSLASAWTAFSPYLAPAALLGTGLELLSAYANAAYAGQRPQYTTETSIMGYERRGQWLHPAISAGMTASSEKQGQIAYERALASPITSMPVVGNIVEKSLELSDWGGFGDWQEKERQAQLDLDDAQMNAIALHLGAGLGRHVSGRDEFAQMKDRFFLPSSQFGLASRAAMTRSNFGAYARDGFYDTDVASSLQTIYSVSSRPEHSGLFWQIANGADPFSVAPTVGKLLAAQGDLGGIASMQSVLDKSVGRQGYNDLISGGRLVEEIRNAVQQSQSQFQAASVSGAGYQELTSILRTQYDSLRQLYQLVQGFQASAPADQRGDFNTMLRQIDAEGARILYQTNVEYSQRGATIGAGIAQSQTALTRTLYSGGGPNALRLGYRSEAQQLLQQVALLREQARRTDIYSPAERAQFEAEAAQAEQQANIMIPREYSQTLYGIAGAQAGFAGAQAATRQQQASLFGGPIDITAAGVQQAGVIEKQIQAINDLLQRGNLSLEEQIRYQTQIVDLRRSEVNVTEQAFRQAAQVEVSNAQTRFGTAATQERTAFMTGRVGGAQAEQTALGVLDRSAGALKAATDYVNLLRQRGVSEDNPEMVSARAAVAQAQQQQAGAEMGLANAPVSLGTQRELSAAQYRAQALQMMPGSYGNLRGALVTEMRDIEKEAQEKQQQYQAVVQRYGGEQNVPEDVQYGFQQQMQQLGLQEASAYQQLSYGWESRLVSQALGAPGNFGYIANRFPLMRAVEAGVVNPHFGATQDENPYFLRRASEFPAPSLLGNTSSPSAFALTAVAGAKPKNEGFGVSGLPNFPTGSNLYGRPGAGSGGGGSGDTMHVQVDPIEITIRWPDGSVAWQGRAGGRSLGQQEDLSNLVSQFNRGQQ